MYQQKTFVVNSQSAVRVVVLPRETIPVPVEEIKYGEVFEPKPKRRTLPGVDLLKKMMRDRERRDGKRDKKEEHADVPEPLIDQDAVEVAVARIIADLE